MHDKLRGIVIRVELMGQPRETTKLLRAQGKRSTARPEEGRKRHCFCRSPRNLLRRPKTASRSAYEIACGHPAPGGRWNRGRGRAPGSFGVFRAKTLLYVASWLLKPRGPGAALAEGQNAARKGPLKGVLSRWSSLVRQAKAKWPRGVRCRAGPAGLGKRFGHQLCNRPGRWSALLVPKSGPASQASRRHS